MPHALRASMPGGGDIGIAPLQELLYSCTAVTNIFIWRRVYRVVWRDSEENTIRSLCIVSVLEFRVDYGTHVVSYDMAMKISFFSLRITTRRYLWPSKPGVILSTVELKSGGKTSRMLRRGVMSDKVPCQHYSSTVRSEYEAIYLPCPRVYAHYIKLRFVMLWSYCILLFDCRLVGGILSVRTPFNG